MKAGILVALTLLIPGIGRAERTETTGRIAEGTKWETGYVIVDSGIPGPTVVVTGGIHGDEPAGHRSATQIRHWPIAKGRLIVLPKVNVRGLAEGTRSLPGEPEALRDLNRNFPGEGEEAEGVRGELATELWSFVKASDPDWVLDLHEGFDFNVSHEPKPGKKRSVGSSIIYFGGDRLDPLVVRALEAANAHVADPDRRFVPLRRGPVNGSFARACDRELGADSLILETTSKDQPISLRTREHRAMANVLLRHIGIIDADCSDVLAAGADSAQIQVGIFDGPGTGATGVENIPRIVDDAPGMAIQFLGPADIRPVILAQFDVLVFPGGSGSKQALALGDEGSGFVRDFVKRGGGYVGVCGGAYLCSAHYPWSLGLVDAAVFTGAREIEGVGVKQMWYRGEATRVDLELSDAGAQLFSGVPREFDVRYHNGPIFSPKNLPEIEDYTPLAWFRSEQVRYGPQKGTMIDTPAIVSGRFGAGRVISISPHPEADAVLESIVVESIEWAAGMDVSVGR